MKLIKNRKSISSQLIILVVIALATASIFFAIFHTVASHTLSNYLFNTGYVDKVANKYIDEFKKYVNDNHLSTSDKKELNAWADEKEIIYIEIFDGERYIYTTGEPIAGKAVDSDTWGSPDSYDLIMDFADGEFYVGFYGNYTYKFFYYTLAVELVTSFIIFFIILMIGLRRSIIDIKTLRDEIDILEGGNLEYELTIEGNNELTDLAVSIENLRKSILQQFENEDRIKQINNKIITDLSHDIRTPLTTVMIYSEAIKHKKYKNEEELHQYLSRIEEKLNQMKYLTDTILEYSLESNTSVKKEIETLTFEEAFSDRMSGFVESLLHSGFNTENKIEWYTDKILADENDIDRMLDNILSNLFKYADKNAPIIISSVRGESIELSFENTKLESDAHKTASAEGYNLGIKNINKLMTKINGTCTVEDSETKFKITLSFPVT